MTEAAGCGIDIIKNVNLRCGLQIRFTVHFKCWLHFEKYFLAPALSSGRPFTRGKLQSMIRDQPVPYFARRNRGVNKVNWNKSKSTYRKLMAQFWEITCNSRVFEVRRSDTHGFFVISKTPSLCTLNSALRSFHVCIDRGTYDALYGEYGSLYSDERGNAYILYGPLQFVNHSCGSLLSIREVRNAKPNSFTIKFEYDEDKYGISAVAVGEEVLVRYNSPDKLWFQCKCPMHVK